MGIYNLELDPVDSDGHSLWGGETEMRAAEMNTIPLNHLSITPHCLLRFLTDEDFYGYNENY